MNRTAAMKTLYLASAVGTLMLLGCSAADVSQETPQQAGKAGTAGSRGLLSGLAGAASGGSGNAGASAGGSTATAGAATAGAAAGGAATGGTSGASGSPGFAGFPIGGGNSFSLGGFGGNDAWIQTIIQNGFAGGDGSIHIGTGGGTGIQFSSGGSGGTRLQFSP